MTWELDPYDFRMAGDSLPEPKPEEHAMMTDFHGYELPDPAADHVHTTADYGTDDRSPRAKTNELILARAIIAGHSTTIPVQLYIALWPADFDTDTPDARMLLQRYTATGWHTVLEWERLEDFPEESQTAILEQGADAPQTGYTTALGAARDYALGLGVAIIEAAALS